MLEVLAAWLDAKLQTASHGAWPAARGHISSVMETRKSLILSFSSLTLSFNSKNNFNHVLTPKIQEGIDIYPVFQMKLHVSLSNVSAFFVVRFHICVAISYVCKMLMTDFHMSDATFHWLSNARRPIQLRFLPPKLLTISNRYMFMNHSLESEKMQRV